MFRPFASMLHALQRRPFGNFDQTGQSPTLALVGILPGATCVSLNV